MATSRASTVAEYLDRLPPDRRKVIATVRSLVRKNLPKGYREVMNWGMISWEIPLSRYPNTYNKQPLCYVALAVQKNYYSLHLMGVYTNPEHLARLRDGFNKAGKKLDMGKSCVRFKRLEDLPLETIGETVSSMTPEEYIAIVERYRK